MVTAALERHGGRLDVLCCNAGILPNVPLSAMTDADIDEMLAVNVKGTMLCVQACTAALEASGRGRVVLTSSITGPVTGFPGWSHYGASKAAQLGFMRTAALELAPKRITVNGEFRRARGARGGVNLARTARLLLGDRPCDPCPQRSARLLPFSPACSRSPRQRRDRGAPGAGPSGGPLCSSCMLRPCAVQCHASVSSCRSPQGPEYIASTEACVPLKRLGSVDDIGHAVLFFASAEAGYITGQSLIVDGGQVLPECPAAIL